MIFWKTLPLTMACVSSLLCLSHLYYPITKNTVTFELQNFFSPAGADEQGNFVLSFFALNQNRFSISLTRRLN